MMFRQFQFVFVLVLIMAFSASATFAGSLAPPSILDVRGILSDLSDRGVRLNWRFLDPGDIGHAYVFTGAVDLAVLGSGKNNSRSELLGFARTGDKRNGGAANPFVDDGDAGNRIDMAINRDGQMTDDLMALLTGLGTGWLSAATIAPGAFLAFNVKGTRSRAPIDTVIFTGAYYSALYRAPLSGPGGAAPAPISLPPSVLMGLAGIASLAGLRATRRRAL